MAAIDTHERRDKLSERRVNKPVIFPLFDSNGEAVLWNRRKTVGRRKADRKPSWNRKDLPGFALLGIMFVVLVLAVLQLKANNFLLVD